MSKSVVVPLVDLQAQYRTLKQEITQAVGSVLESGQYALGPEVAAFEQEFAQYCGVREAVAVNSGTSALHVALLASGVGPGDEVITVPFTFIATAAAISYTGAVPVFVDVEPTCLTLDPARLEEAITRRTKAIVPVHLYGQMADMTAIMDAARRHGLAVIEDAAQAHGASLGGRSSGAIGVSGCFSFYPGKNLGACGEGGIAVTNDPQQAAAMRALRDWGQARRYVHDVIGYNYRMDGVQGAILRIKLRHLDRWTEARREHAALYDRLLVGTAVATPMVRSGARHVYHLYAVRASGRDALRQDLQAAGIATGIHYPIPVHLQPAYAHLGHKPGDFPVSERASAEVLSLPMFAELNDEQIHVVAHAVFQHAGAATI